MTKIGFFHPSTFKLDGGAMFGIIPKPLWEKKIKPDEFNRIKMSLRVMFFETKNKFIIIDTGIGEYHDEKFHQHFDLTGSENPLINCLKQIGKKPDDVTDIILTHLHFDHVGGLGTKDHELIFKNATLHLHKKHFEYSQHPTRKDQGSFHSDVFNPLINEYQAMDKLNLLSNDEGLILEDGDFKLNYKISFGHTPYMLHPYTEKYIYMADLTPMGHHIRIPWVMGYDMQPGEATKYKEEFYQFIIQNDLTMVFEHDSETWGAKIVEDGRGDYKASEFFTSSQNEVEIIEDK